MTKDNRGYDPDLFTVSKVSRDFALIPGVGKFCKCGCGRQVKGKHVNRVRNGKRQGYFIEPTYNQLYAARSCQNRVEYKKSKGRPNKDKKEIRARIKLEIIADKIPYRELIIIHNKSMKTLLKITAKDKLLWDYIERFLRYTKVTHQSSLISVTSHSQSSDFLRGG